jgi:TolB-like protein
MFTDIEGYTAMMQQSEEKAMLVRGRHREILQKEHKQFNGRIIQYYGDGSVSIFQSAVQAVGCALAMQQEFCRATVAPVRIGIHIGDIVFDEEQIFGDGVNLASRIESLGIAGCVLLSDKVNDEIRNHPGFKTVSVGIFHFKNIERKVEVFALDHEGLVKPQPGSLTGKTEEKKNTSDRGIGKPTPKSLAVLPFVNMSNDPEQEYFTDGLTEEIITDLSQIEELRVISRGSVMTFKGTNKKIGEIAAEARVKYILQGSVRKAGKNLRINTQLINAEEDEHLWAEKYTGTLDDIFAIQEQISRQIADKLRIKLSEKESDLLHTNPIQNLRAYELYQRAQYEFFRFKEDGLNRALKYLDEAIKAEGENSLLYARLGLTYVNLLNVSDEVEKEYLEKAKLFASKAFELDSASLAGHVLLGWIHFLDGDLRDAVKYLKKAFLINANDPDVLLPMILAHFYIGVPSEIEKALAVLSKIDPLNPVYCILQSILHYSKGDLSMALEESKSAYEIYPEVPQNQLYYAYYLASKKYFDQACTVLDRLVHDNQGTVFMPLGLLLRNAFSNSGMNDILSQTQKAKLRMDCEWSWLVADAYSTMGNKDESIDWLEHIVQRGFINYPILSQYDPFLENIRNESRFQRLMAFTKDEWDKVNIGIDDFFDSST